MYLCPETRANGLNDEYILRHKGRPSKYPLNIPIRRSRLGIPGSWELPETRFSPAYGIFKLNDDLPKDLAIILSERSTGSIPVHPVPNSSYTVAGH